MKLPRRWDRISTSLAAVLNYLLGRGQQRFLIRLRVVMIWNKSGSMSYSLGHFPTSAADRKPVSVGVDVF
jgi:hypothetical protein